MRRTKETGITLIALVITVVVLLILAGVAINLTVGDNGIFRRAEESTEIYKISQAREKIELTLANASIDKAVNEKYNENEFLDEFILGEIKDAQILDDIVIVDGYGFELDRSVPKIGEYVGKSEELVFPYVNVSVTYEEDYKSAKITIKAQEGINGISKIEIIQDGVVIKEYTYENVTEEITQDYTTKQNGKYIIKVYSKLTSRGRVQVEGVKSIIYTPNGDTEYKKAHSVKVEAYEGIGTVKSIKYQWLETLEEPAENTFIESCNDGDTITKGDLTGKYYLWTLLETEEGDKNITRSELFYFDNKKPEVSVTSTPETESSFILEATAKDEDSGIAKYEIYVNGELKETSENSVSISISIENVDAELQYSCKVIVYDVLGNASTANVSGRALIHTWEVFDYVNEETGYYEQYFGEPQTLSFGTVGKASAASFSFNASTGTFGFGQSYGAILRHVGVGNPFCDWTGGGYYILDAIINDNTGVVRQYLSRKAIIAKQGKQQYDDVTSSDGSKYPQNGKQGEYWYVYKGLI